MCWSIRRSNRRSREDTGVTASAATATRIYASEGDLDLSFETLGTFEDRDGVRALILHATANRYLESVLSFVPDDAFGEAHIISERRLEVVLHEGHELNSVLSGLPLFVAVNTFTGSPNRYTAKIEVAPRFYDFRGSSAIWIDEAVTPLYKVNGVDNLVYRGNAGALASQFTVTAPDGAPTVARVDADSFHLDWSYTALHQAIDPHTVPLTFNADLTGGGTAQKTSRLVARVTSLALTSGDAYEVWPSASCQSAVYSCIHAQPAGATDFTGLRHLPRGLALHVRQRLRGDAARPSLAHAHRRLGARARARGLERGVEQRRLARALPITTYSTPACPAAPVTIQGVMAQLNATIQGFPRRPTARTPTAPAPRRACSSRTTTTVTARRCSRRSTPSPAAATCRSGSPRSRCPATTAMSSATTRCSITLARARSSCSKGTTGTTPEFG